ncbi:otoraplin-like [Hemiscyllium ocellatum]|uniref:otoraplin-like n=1 Tax=Hemiscyllium ocellatum TaxID=170820 RepID=UPI002966A9A1|nr:otoraplin-like [Hemiscyllium ocellatum]
MVRESDRSKERLFQAVLKPGRRKKMFAISKIKLARFACHLFPFLLLGLTQDVKADFMDKLAKRKVCADKDCSYVISTGRVVDDYIAPDCRFLDLKEGQLIYVYSKLVRERKGGEFWSGSIYSEEPVDEMGVVGYFPSTLIDEQYVFQNTTVRLPTTAIDFYCD